MKQSLATCDNTFIVELTYCVKKEKKSLSKCVSLDLNKALVCDFCVDNFVTIVSSKPGVRALLIKDKVLKSINQNFVMLSHGKFVEMIGYKAEECGIRVTVREESYTSKASALDFDKIPTLDKKSSRAILVLLGKRI